MQYFEKDFVQFFKELEENNHKEWFDENRKRYEKVIKEPFKAFVGELISQVSADDPEVRVEPKNCIFRINRDIRFSKDKTPYKTSVSAAVCPGGRKNMTTPGIYVELNANEVRLYSGIYKCSTAELKRVRTYLLEEQEELQTLYSDKKFVSNFNQILGDKNKRVPKEFQESIENEPLLANKQFYFFKKYDASLITSEELMQQIMQDYFIAKPLMFFLRRALEE